MADGRLHCAVPEFWAEFSEPKSIPNGGGNPQETGTPSVRAGPSVTKYNEASIDMPKLNPELIAAAIDGFEAQMKRIDAQISGAAADVEWRSHQRWRWRVATHHKAADVSLGASQESR